jgi:cell division protein FtsQ
MLVSCVVSEFTVLPNLRQALAGLKRVRPPSGKRRRVGVRRRVKRRAASAVRWLPAVTAAFGGFVFLALSDGGRMVRPADPLIQQIDKFAAHSGLGIRSLSLTGHVMTPDRDIFDALALENVRSLVAFDAAAARQRIEKLPWIAEARIRRSFPHHVEISVRERAPFAVWAHDGREILVDREGRLLAYIRPGAVRDLPLITGLRAPQAAAGLFDALAAAPALAEQVTSVAYVDGRRWTLNLADDRKVLLPERGLGPAFAELLRGDPGSRLLDRSFAAVDLRVHGQIVLRITPGGVPHQRAGNGSPRRADRAPRQPTSSRG